MINKAQKDKFSNQARQYLKDRHVNADKSEKIIQVILKETDEMCEKVGHITSADFLKWQNSILRFIARDMQFDDHEMQVIFCYLVSLPAFNEIMEKTGAGRETCKLSVNEVVSSSKHEIKSNDDSLESILWDHRLATAASKSRM